MATKAWLEGHMFDLEDLAALLPSGDVRMVKEGDRFYLTAAELTVRHLARPSTRPLKSCLPGPMA